MEDSFKIHGMQLPPEMTSKTFYSRLVDLIKGDGSSKNGMDNAEMPNYKKSNSRPINIGVPEKRKKVVAVIKASKSSRPSPKSRNVSQSVRSRTSIDSGCASSCASTRTSTDSLFGPTVMELEDNPSPLSGDPLLSTTSTFMSSMPSPSNTPDIPSPISTCSESSSQSAVLPVSHQKQMLTSHNFTSNGTGDIPFCVLEDKKMPDDEMSRCGYVPSLVVRQAAKEPQVNIVPPLLNDREPVLPEIHTSFLDTMFKMWWQ